MVGWSEVGRERVGLTSLDLTVLSRLFDDGLFPSRSHGRAGAAVASVTATGVCGASEAWSALRRLAASWLLPVPLVDPNGDVGSPYDQGASPQYVELRLSNAGQLAVQSARQHLPPLPIGLLNGDLDLVLGLGVPVWPGGLDDRPPTVRPCLPPDPVLGVMVDLLGGVEPDHDDIPARVGGPWLGPFLSTEVPLEELLATGRQEVVLTLRPDPHDGWSPPPAAVVLDLGGPLADVLRRWTARATAADPPSAVTAALADLRRLVCPGEIARLPGRGGDPPDGPADR